MKNSEKARDDYNAELAIARKNVGKLFDSMDDFDPPEEEEETLTIYNDEEAAADESIFVFEESNETNERPLPRPKPAIMVNTQALDAALEAKGIKRAPVYEREAPEVSEQPKTPERPRLSERPKMPERPNISERPRIPERPNISERPERPKRLERYEESERPARQERTERPASNYTLEEKPEDSNFSRSYTIHRVPERRYERPERLERPKRLERPERLERPGRLGQSERDELLGQPERAQYNSRPARAYSQKSEEAAAPVPAFFRGIAVGLTLLFMMLLAFLVYNNIMLGAQLQEAQLQLGTIPELQQERTDLLLELETAREELAALALIAAGGTVVAPSEGYYGDAAYPEYTPYQDTAPPEQPGQPEQPAGTRTHTVVAGDNLSRIARQFYGSTDNSYIQRIMQANNIADANVISPGMELVIP